MNKCEIEKILIARSDLCDTMKEIHYGYTEYFEEQEN